MGKQFRNDYSEGAQKDIFKAVANINNSQCVGYGLDEHSINAEKAILKRFSCSKGSVYFVTGGTQANMLVLSYLLKNYEGVISCDTGHINVHETAAIEGSGHKIIVCPNINGKLTEENIRLVYNKCTDEHMVKPRAIYISNSTEIGTIYSKKELICLRNICDELGLFLFMDGARLAVALTCKENDVEPEFLGQVCDAFYVGGTKNGFLSGEAIVFKDKHLSENFRYHIKNKGAMLAKGFIVAAQFERAFKDDLYFKIAKSTNNSASYLRNRLNGVAEFAYNSPTNQIFIKLPKAKANKVMKCFGCELWEDCGTNRVIRIVTSFATTKEDCDALINFIKNV